MLHGWCCIADPLSSWCCIVSARYRLWRVSKGYGNRKLPVCIACIVTHWRGLTLKSRSMTLTGSSSDIQLPTTANTECYSSTRPRGTSGSDGMRDQGSYRHDHHQHHRTVNMSASANSTAPMMLSVNVMSNSLDSGTAVSAADVHDTTSGGSCSAAGGDGDVDVDGGPHSGSHSPSSVHSPARFTAAPAGAHLTVPHIPSPASSSDAGSLNTTGGGSLHPHGSAVYQPVATQSPCGSSASSLSLAAPPLPHRHQHPYQPQQQQQHHPQSVLGPRHLHAGVAAGSSAGAGGIISSASRAGTAPTGAAAGGAGNGRRQSVLMDHPAIE